MYTVGQVRRKVDGLHTRINQLRGVLASDFVEKTEILYLMVICTLAQEPLLLVGRPGTTTSDLVVMFRQALGLTDLDGFAYMLTDSTETGESIGPVDIDQFKGSDNIRRIAREMPEAKIVFLEELFKSNAAILNPLLTMSNKPQYDQDGLPTPVAMRMRFGATKEIPALTELDARKDRFTLKLEALLDRGLCHNAYRAFQQRHWADLTSLEDFHTLKRHLDTRMLQSTDTGTDGVHGDRQGSLPDEVFAYFRCALRTLEQEDNAALSDRKVIQLYPFIRTRAFLLHVGTVMCEDPPLMCHIPDQLPDFQSVREKVDALLQL